jgi:hypothetical protein
LEANNVVQLDAFRKPAEHNWGWHSLAEYQQRVQILIDEGLIQSGTVVMNEHGIPTVYIVPKPAVDHINVTFSPFEANNI